MSTVEATIKDQANSSLVQVEGIAVTASASNPTSGQILRQTVAIADGNNTENYATVSGGGLDVNVVGTYNSTLPSLTTGQTAPLQADSSGRLIVSPISITSQGGVGIDTVFPTESSITSNNGASLGALPAGASAVLIHIPPGASVSLYFAINQLSSLSAAVPYSSTYANPSGATSSLDITIPLNAVTATQCIITNVTAGTSTSYISGLPTYRFI